jgi:hypothetical protein
MALGLRAAGAGDEARGELAELTVLSLRLIIADYSRTGVVRPMPENSTAGACPWCGSDFEPRRDGGKAQRFCREACRRAFDAAGRRWVAGAIAAGTVTIADLRDGSAATRALGGMRKIPSETDRPVPKPPDPVSGALSAAAERPARPRSCLTIS